MEQEERDALGRGEHPTPKRLKTTDPYKKNVVVLLESDVRCVNDQVLMPIYMDMARIHEPDKGQYKSNIEFTTEMTEMQVKERLLHDFPILRPCARLSCASAKDNRTMLDFHEESQHRGLWNGAMIKKHLKGNSALYVFGETSESGRIPTRLGDPTVAYLGPTSSGSVLPASERLKLISRKSYPSGSPVSLRSSPNQIEQGYGILQVDSSQQRTDQQPISLEAPVIWSRVPETTPPLGYVGQATKEQQRTREDQSNRPKVVSEISVHADLLPGSQCGLHSSVLVSSQSQIGQGQITSTCLGNNTVGDQISQNAQTSGASLTEPGILQNDPLQQIALTADQQPTSHMSDSGRDSIRSNALGLAVASDPAEQSGDISAPSEIFDLSEDIDSILEEGSEVMFECLTQSSGVVKEIIPSQGCTETDIRFCILLGQKLPRNYKGLSFQANFANIATVPLKRDGPALTGNIISSLAGKVKVTLEYKGSNGKSIGFTYFEFTKNSERVILEEISKVRMSQDAMYKTVNSLAVSRSSGVQQETPPGARGTGVGSSNMNKRNDALPEEILTLLVYKAAEIEGREFLEMVFSTSVGRVLFNHYRNNLTLPEDVARANGHTILGDFLEDVNERLSKEVCRGDNYETIDWLELKYAVDKKICLPSANDAQAVSSPVDDVNQSGYEADDEASSLPSPADTNANGSEMHDSEHGDIEQITSGKDDSRDSITTETERRRHQKRNERQAGSGSSFANRDDSEKEMESLPYGTDIVEIKVPAEILAQGPVAKRLYEEALKDGSLSVYRTRILITGQDRAGKTSLKKSLLGQPFDPEEQSTDGIEVDPSKCAIKVDQIKNWNSTGKKESCLSECCEEISRMLAEKRYQWILQKEQMESEEVPHEEPKEKPAEDSNIKDENEILRTEDSPKSPNVYSSTSEKQDNETENQTRGCLEEKRSDCSSESGLIPDTVVEHADRLLKEMIDGKDRQNPQDDKESIVTIDLWDFAGQHLYYAAHSVFFTKRAVYVLVHNLSKELNDPAQPCARQGCHNIILENPGRITNLEDLLSWLATIHSIKPKDEGMPVDNSGTGISYLRPPVFIVGTHADQPTENIEIVTTKIQQAISGKEYDKHVIRPFFSIDNTQGHQSSFGKTQRNESVLPKVKRLFVGKSQRSHQRGKSGEKGKATGDEIHILRAKIMEILRQEPYMGEKIPVRWFNFEKLVETLVASNVYFMDVEELRTLVENANIIEGDDHFKTMLNFYHDLGMIVKHRNTVILKAQWLIDLFRKLITIPTFDKMDPVESKHWPELERNGVLSMELVDHVFTKFLRRGVIKEDILDMMEQFGLIAKFSSPALPDVKYFVPCQLKSPPIELCKMEPSSTDPCPLYLYFLDGFVPHGLFPRLVSSSTAWVATTGSSHLPKLYQNGAWFVLEGKVIHDMILICKKRFIKILLREVKEAKAVALPLSTSRSAEVARRVRLFLKSSLEHFSQEFPYLSKLRYQFSVECPYCLQRVEECAIHRKPSCTHEDCLHLLEVKQGKHLICMESAGYNEVLTVQGRDLWFSSEGTQDPSKTGSLRVTLLASEWGSSMGGMSTINRQLAILLAKHREIEVTLLVPKFSCSEEDRRTAWNHNVLIKEAEKRPGFDPLDWLSFPPKDLIIDVILGHGAQLGKQAQVIRESHNCQWVQVVHTAPEELGMFKTHPRAVAKGELKTTTEVDLCKLADLVVAIGPKLAEAYSAYLRPCQKQQDILKLTPGTFKEFSALIQDPVDLGNFRVLTFGRGDPEDFSLKGYDIAAKAVVELNDYSYHLIYVGAPDGKQEAVKERLLQSGISNRQLTVRTFLQDKEKLKECFCEVDLCIMPSRTEGFGLTGLEALSAGLPILVSGNSGFGDALYSVPSGRSFVVDSDDSKVWAEAIAGIRVKERLERLQETQLLRTSYEEQFSWEKQCDLLVDKMWNKVYGAGLLRQVIQDLQQMHLFASKVNSNTHLTEELTQIALDKGFRISDSQGSGNCMFHALLEQLEPVKGIKMQHGHLRQSLVQYLRENPKLTDGTDLFHFVHGHETWADYLTYMEQDGSWGDHLILCAAANSFKTCIHVVSSLQNEVVVKPHRPVNESKPLVLGHIHEVHYVSLQPIQG